MQFLRTRLLNMLDTYLDEGETVLDSIWGSLRPGGTFNLALLALTSKRVMLYNRGITGYAFSYIPLHQITMVEENTSRLTDYAIRIHSVSGSLLFYPSGRKSERAKVQALTADIRKRAGQIIPAAANADEETESLRTLRDLKKMCDEGLISNEEYTEKKRQLLEHL